MGFYGAVCVRLFAGPQVAELLFFGKQSWPLSYYINLPLIPLALILSRTTLLDSLFPFLPLTLVLSSTTSPSSPTLRLIDLSTLSWPISPALTLCLLPWVRFVYSKARARVFSSALGVNLQPQEGLVGLMRELGDGGDGEGDGNENLVIVAELDVEEQDENGNRIPGPGQGERRDENDVVGGEDALHPAAGAGNRLRVGVSRFTSLVVGALLFPLFSSMAGGALFWLATRSATGTGSMVLRKILGLQAVLAVAKSGGRMAGLGLKGSGAGGWLAKAAVGATGKIELDPVWIRNSIGGGLVVLGRDREFFLFFPSSFRSLLFRS